MATYSIHSNVNLDNAATLILLPTLYEIRIASVNYASTSTAATYCSAYRLYNPAYTGGTVSFPRALRANSPGCKTTAVTTVTGLSYSDASCFAASLISAGGSAGWIDTPAKYTGATGSFQAPMAMTVAPGNGFYLTNLSGAVTATVVFEEKRLSAAY